MKFVNVKIVNNSGLPLPKYQTEGSAGLDLNADVAQFVTEGFMQKPNRVYGCVRLSRCEGDPKDAIIHMGGGSQVLIPTGIFIQLPEGFEADIRPRSGLALKNGITVLNTPGTIDCDYTGQVHVLLWNTRDTEFVIHHGDRIAQMVVLNYAKVSFKECDLCDFDKTSRGANGHGSTGVVAIN